MKYVVYSDSAKQWRWRFLSANGKIIAVSSEGYFNRSDCERGIELVKGLRIAPVYFVQ